MIWPELAELHQQGFSIEAHTVGHPVLSDTSQSDLAYELLQPRSAIQKNIPGAQAFFLAYPFGVGSHDERVLAMVRQAGYLAAVGYSIDEGIANPADPDLYAIRRSSVAGNTTLVLNFQRPDTFFMRRVNPGFPLPNPQVDRFSVQDSYGAVRNQFYSGEDIVAQVTASNWGQAAPVSGTLELRDSAKKVIYNSHAQSANANSPLGMFTRGKGKGKFLFFLSAPAVTSQQKLEYALQVYDLPHLLNFFNSEFRPAFEVLDSPISVRANTNQLSLSAGQPQELVFTVANTGSAATDMQLTVSFSAGLAVTAVDSAWQALPPGSQMDRRGCSGPCAKSTDLIYELRQAEFPVGEKTFKLSVRPAAGAVGEQWVQYRLSMNVPGQITPYPLLHDPLGGKTDQQGYFAYRIPVALK